MSTRPKEIADEFARSCRVLKEEKVTHVRQDLHAGVAAAHGVTADLSGCIDAVAFKSEKTPADPVAPLQNRNAIPLFFKDHRGIQTGKTRPDNDHIGLILRPGTLWQGCGQCQG